MAYASITYTSATGTTFALTNSSGDPIPYLRQADIAVTVNGSLKTLTTDYTFNSAGTAIVLNVSVTNATVVISRTTDISDATVVYTAGSTLTAQDLNNADNQIRYGLQEFSDTYGALTTGTGDLSSLGGFVGASETWVADDAHAATTGAIDGRIDSKIDTALTTDVVAGDSITVTDNSPGSGQITVGVTNASISTAKLVDSSVTTAKIADGNVTTAKILDSNVTTAKIADLNVTTAKIADNAITTAKIADGTIAASDLASDSVTTAKIVDLNVTTGKLADVSVTTAKLADSSVTSAKIVDGTIVAGDLASDSVTTAKILDSNVTTAKIADSNVTTGKIADSAVTAVKIADGVITSAKLNASTIVTAAEQAASTPDDTSFFTTSAADGRYVNVTGDTMSGALAMGTNKITGLGTPTVNTDAATKAYVDASVAAGVGDADYGDITVSGTGTVWTIDSGVVTSAKIADGTIVNGDINASAAIAGTKVSPDFGSQNATTTGTSTAASFIPTSTTAPTAGLYAPTGSVAISTNGTGRLFVDASGSIGVGVASPVTTLHLQKATGGLAGVQISTSTHGSTLTDGLFVGIDNSIGYLYNYENLPLVFGTNATERMRLDSSGRLGVGTSTVDSLLHLTKSDATAYDAVAIDGQVNVGPTIYLENPAASNASVGGQIVFGMRSTEEQARIGATGGTTPVLTFGTGDVERMRITAAGIGIGTTSPASSLHIAGATPQVRVQDTDGTNQTGIFYKNGAATTFYSQDGTSNGSFQWIQNNGTTSTTSLVLNSAGQLGLGTSSVSSKIHIQDAHTLTADTQIALIENTTTGEPASLAFLARTDSGSTGNKGAIYFDAGAGGGTADNKLQFTAAHQDSITPQVTLDGLGRLGIGSTVPGYPLTVVSDGASQVLRVCGRSSDNNSNIAFSSNNQGTDYAFLSSGPTFLAAAVNGSERCRIDSSGRFLVGTSSSSTNAGSASPNFQVHGISGSPSSSSQTRWSADNAGPTKFLSKSRGASVGTRGAVVSGDQIGSIRFTADDGTNFVEAARIEVEIDGTPGANDMPGRLVFSTTADGSASPTEAVRIDSNQVLIVAGTSAYSDGAIGRPRLQFNTKSGNHSGAVGVADSTSNVVHIAFKNPNGVVGSIATSGSATTYATSSDYRLKENVAPLSGAAARVNQLKPSQFNFKADPTTIVDGFIAHEAQAVVPECVTGTKDEVDADGNPVYQGIDQSKLVPLLTAALQEALVKIETLEARLTAAGI